MSQTARMARLLKASMAVTAEVADAADPERFPEIAKAREWFNTRSPERRAELEHRAHLEG